VKSLVKIFRSVLAKTLNQIQHRT